MNSATPPAPPWSLYAEQQRRGFLTVIFAVTVCASFDYYSLGIVLDLIKNEFKVSDTALGLLGGVCFAFLWALAALPFARWSDRGNRRTVLTAALTGWSSMTVLFGLARSFPQLAFARLGVGAMCPGAIPPAQSLVADYFPPERRGSALAIMLTGTSAGRLIGLALGGYTAAMIGWRNAFVIAGVFGLVLAVITRLMLAEPRLQLGFPAAGPRAETLSHVATHLRGKHSYLYMVVGMCGFMFFSVGTATFLPSFMMRTLHATLTQVSLIWGVTAAASDMLGTLVGGRLADRMSRLDVRWYAWLSTVGCVLGVPLYWVSLSSEHLTTFIVLNFVADLAIGIGTMAFWPALHSVCGNARRAMAVSIAQTSYVIIGVGLGPLATAALSDAFSSSHGAQSLRYALNIMTLALIPAALAFYASGHTLLLDRED